MPLRHLVLVRHGETDGESSIRYYGSTDVELSAAGRAQMRSVASRLAAQRADLVFASTLRRSWAAAALVARGAQVRLEPDLREIHFGRWEGLTQEEIAQQDPILYEDWQKGANGFEYPAGEARAAFRERVRRGLGRILAAPGHVGIGVLHKGVIREIALALTGAALPREQPELGGIVRVSQTADGAWVIGARGSNPAGLEDAA
jgi:broad specificity phosphatase PhoE